MTTTQNHFVNLPQAVQSCPQSQRPQKLIQEIIGQLERSGNQQAQQFGQELDEVMPQILKAWQ